MLLQYIINLKKNILHLFTYSYDCTIKKMKNENYCNNDEVKKGQFLVC